MTERRGSTPQEYRGLERAADVDLEKGGDGGGGRAPLGRKVYVERVEQGGRVNFGEGGGEGRLVLYQEQAHSTVIVVDGSNLPSSGE